MKRDLSQALKKDWTHVQLIVQDESSKKFFIIPDKEDKGYYSTDFFWLPTLDLNEAKESLPMLLIQELQEIGFVPNGYRELVRQTDIVYSFVDRTPGIYGELVCLYVRAYKIDSMWQTDKLPGDMVELAEFAEKSQSAPANSPVVWRAVRQLIEEEKYGEA